MVSCMPRSIVARKGRCRKHARKGHCRGVQPWVLDDRLRIITVVGCNIVMCRFVTDYLNCYDVLIEGSQALSRVGNSRS